MAMLPSVVSSSTVIAPAARNLSVLILTPDVAGHFTPLLAIGEALMERGHNVSVATDWRYKGAQRLQQLCSERGMTFRGYGDEMNDRENDEMLRQLVETGDNLFSASAVLIPTIVKEQEVLLDALKTDFHLLKGTDVAVVGFTLPVVTRWLNTNTNLTVISYSQSIQYSGTNVPLWHFAMHTQSVYPAFLDRLATVLLNVLDVYSCTVDYGTIQYLPSHTPAGVYNPEVAGVAFGFDYSQPLYPMMHFVGPVVSKREELLPNDLQVWLDHHSMRSVLYISMGSLFHITKQLAVSVVNAAIRSSYDILWTMQDSNRYVLDDIDQTLLHNGSIFISSWLPQAAVLRHPSISVAILHCGLGGVNEALMAGVPIIGSPIALDQFGNCARVHNQGLGVCLHGTGNVTSDLLQHSIKEIERGSYREFIRKLNIIFKEAGGVERAADLIEHYHEVGYGHLVPFWAKHQWSTVQYYNLDVYAVIAGVLVLVIFTLYKCTRCVGRRMCSRQHSTVLKTKKD